MGLTIADVSHVRNQPQRYGQLNSRIVDLTGDGSAPAGGELLSASALGFTTIYGVKVLAVTSGIASCFGAIYDSTNGKIIFISQAGAEQTTTTNVTVRVEVLGK